MSIPTKNMVSMSARVWDSRLGRWVTLPRVDVKERLRMGTASLEAPDIPKELIIDGTHARVWCIGDECWRTVPIDKARIDIDSGQAAHHPPPPPEQIVIPDENIVEDRFGRRVRLWDLRNNKWIEEIESHALNLLRVKVAAFAPPD